MEKSLRRFWLRFVCACSWVRATAASARRAVAGAGGCFLGEGEALRFASRLTVGAASAGVGELGSFFEGSEELLDVGWLGGDGVVGWEFDVGAGFWIGGF